MHIAHIRPDTKQEQTVAEHCRGVQAYCKSFGAKIGLGGTAGLIGILHDLGKDKNEFDTYLRDSADHPGERTRRGQVNHSTAGARYVFENYYEGDACRKITAQLVAMSILGHHGGIDDVITPDGTDEFEKRMDPKKEIFFEESVQNFTQHCMDENGISACFDEACGEVEQVLKRMTEGKILNHFSMHLLERYLFSCLIDGDRLDTAIFMGDRPDLEAFEPDALWQELSSKLEEEISKFPKETKVEMLRGEISDVCKGFASNAPGIYQLCVPTGGGKTLSSLRYALQHASIKAHKKQRIFYVIPFTTIIDQNARVIKNMLGREDVILEHHSNIVNDNENEDYKLLTERWDSPVILTTMVQFLNTLFSGGTQNVRRLHQLANSIIILDEIQSVPVKCVYMLNSALNFLSKICNATIILCTATQPLLSKTQRPLHLSTPTDMIRDVENKFRQFKRVCVQDKTRAGGYDISELAEFVLDKMESTPSMLVILNTKNSVRELFQTIKQSNELLPKAEKLELFHLSTSMCPAHRLNVLDAIKSRLGKGRVLCISTQLIEAGVDISFHGVVRAIAGMDSIAQAAGRCNRHGENPSAEVYIVNLKEESLSRLPDIKEGQSCTKRVLDEFPDNPQLYGEDLLSPKTISQYYQYYFYKRERDNEMVYRIPKHNASLYDWLSENHQGTYAYGGNPPYPLKQAFKTAGQHFCVIDNNTVGVLVPHGRGEELIAAINGNCTLPELKAYLKEAQQYSVNLYDIDIKKLENSIFRIKNAGVLALDKTHYNDETGVVTEGGMMETLNA